MSRRTRRSLANVDADIVMEDEDDDVRNDPSFTQAEPLATQASSVGGTQRGGEFKSANRLDKSLAFISQWTPDDRHRKIKDVIRLALFCQHAQVPLKREDIMKKILNDPKAYPGIMKLAQDYLSDVFGFELVPLESHERSHGEGGNASKTSKKKDTSGGNGGASANAFVVTSILTNAERQTLLNLESHITPANSLLLIILTLIFVSGKIIREDALDSYLRRLEISRQRKHVTFGDVNLVFSTYMRQGYLDKIKTGRGESEVVNYVWGPRAKAEFSDEHIAHFICHFYPEKTELEKQRLAQDVLHSNIP